LLFIPKSSLRNKWNEIVEGELTELKCLSVKPERRRSKMLLWC